MHSPASQLRARRAVRSFRRFDHRPALAVAASVAGLLVSGATIAQAANNPGTGDSGFFTFRPDGGIGGTQINVASGNALIRTGDLVDGPLTYHVVVDRTYNSLAANDFSILSPRWKFDVGPDTKLTVESNQDVTVAGPSGYRIRFVRQTDGSYVAPDDFDGTLAKTPNGWTLTRTSQNDEFGFDGSGNLTWTKDSELRDFTVQGTSAAGRTVLSSYGTNSGRRVNLSYNGDSLVRLMDDPASGHHSYRYTAGRLTEYESPTGAITTYGYDSNGFLDEIVEPSGATVELDVLASGKIDAITTTLAGGVPQTTGFNYVRRAYKTDVAAPDSTRRTYAYDDDWRVTRDYNPDVVPTAQASVAPAQKYTNGTDAVPVPVSVAAVEPDGAGIVRIEVRKASDGAKVGEAVAPCEETPFDFVCPLEFEASISVDMAGFAEGRHQLKAVAIDDEGNEGSSSVFEVVVDRTGPTINLGGTLHSLRGVPASAGDLRVLNVTANDDLSGVPNGGVGVDLVVVSMDTSLVAFEQQSDRELPLSLSWDTVAVDLGVLDPEGPDDPAIDEEEPEESEEPTDLEESYPPEGTAIQDGDGSVDYDNGPHRFTVVATDHLGNASSVTFNTGSGS